MIWATTFRARPVSLDLAAARLAKDWDATTVTARLRSKGYTEGWVEFRAETIDEPTPAMLVSALALLGAEGLAVSDVSVREEQR